MTSEQLLDKLGEMYLEIFYFVSLHCIAFLKKIKLKIIRYAGAPPADLTPEELANHENLLPIRKLRYPINLINVYGLL